MFSWTKKKKNENTAPQQPGEPAGRMGHRPPHPMHPHPPGPNMAPPGPNGRPPHPNQQPPHQGQQHQPPPRPRQPYKPNYSSVSGVSVSFDDVSVRCAKPDGVHESVRWDELVGVFIMTESEGKYATEMHWILAGKERGGCVFPNTAAGAAEIIRYMQDTLKGFDNKAIIDAMESQESKKYLIWKSAT